MEEENGQKEEIGDGKDEERPKMEWKRADNRGKKEWGQMRVKPPFKMVLVELSRGLTPIDLVD